MTHDRLAESYLVKATERVRVLEVLMEQGAWSDALDIDLVPTEGYSREDAARAQDDARFVLEPAQRSVVG